ncbi:hypothetical protein ACLX1H_002161 [Fusarium chlamydosporum]
MDFACHTTGLQHNMEVMAFHDLMQRRVADANLSTLVDDVVNIRLGRRARFGLSEDSGAGSRMQMEMVHLVLACVLPTRDEDIKLITKFVHIFDLKLPLGKLESHTKVWNHCTVVTENSCVWVISEREMHDQGH